MPLFPHATPEDHGRFREAFARQLDGGAAFAGAVDAAATQAFGADASALATVVVNVVQAFEAESGATIRQDAMAVSRVVSAAIQAGNELEHAETSELNLPFLTATATGPKHLARRLSRAELLDLAAGVQPAPRASHPEPAEPPKKRGWWPF
jgi:hypothetical protein